MLVKNENGDIVGMEYDSAVAAVTAGTHTIVNVDEKGEPKPEDAKVKADGEAKPAEASPEQPLPKDSQAAKPAAKR